MSTPTKYEGHTPGPWIATFNEYGGYDCMTSAWHVKSEHAYVTTIDCGKNGNNLTTEADARLIADAPTLLAERDALQAENTRLREALEAIKSSATLKGEVPAGLKFWPCTEGHVAAIKLAATALAANQ